MLAVQGLGVEIGGRRVLDGIDLDVGPQERVALLGASGSGKSLTAAAVLGRLPHGAAARGSVRIGGTEVLGVPAARRGRSAGVAAVFQDSRTALNPLVRTGVQLVAPLRHHSGRSPEEARSAAVEMLAAVGLDDPLRVLRGYPGELSGGQRQRVCIALALACQPQLLLVDEPTTALDVVSQHQVLQVLDERMAASDAGLLFITHDLAAAAQLLHPRRGAGRGARRRVRTDRRAARGAAARLLPAARRHRAGDPHRTGRGLAGSGACPGPAASGRRRAPPLPAVPLRVPRGERAEGYEGCTVAAAYARCPVITRCGPCAGG